MTLMLKLQQTAHVLIDKVAGDRFLLQQCHAYTVKADTIESTLHTL